MCEGRECGGNEKDCTGFICYSGFFPPLLSIQLDHYENTPIQIYRKFHLQKTENFQIKNSDIFHNSGQNIDRGYSLELPRRGGSNEYPQSMFWAEIRKIMYTPVNPSFTIQKWGLRGSKLYRHVFVMWRMEFARTGKSCS